MRDVAELICDMTESESEIVLEARPVDDPQRRCPDITLTKEYLDWHPKVSLEDGLAQTVEWCRDEWTKESVRA